MRKAVETLSIVLFIFFILACKCQSDLLNFSKNRRTPEPAPSSTPAAFSSTPDAAAATPYPKNMNSGSTSNADSRLAIGNYTGSGLNTTYNQKGDFLIRIDSVDAKGAVKGYFEASNGLNGSSALIGGIDNNGKMGLFGKLTDGQGLIISANAAGDTIRGNYVLGDKQKGVQKGEFTVTRR